MSSCKTCNNQSSIINTESEKTQKKIQNQCNVHSSLYTMEFSTLHNYTNNSNEGKKHSSYDRRLRSLKQKVFKGNKTCVDKSVIPKYRNKKKPYLLSSLFNSCN